MIYHIMSNVVGIIAGIGVIGAAVYFMGSASAETPDNGGGNGGIPESAKIYGCTNGTALNYNPSANTDDGSCNYNPGESPEELQEKKDEEQKKKDEEEAKKKLWDDASCGEVWSGSSRKGNSWKKIMSLHDTAGTRGNCDITELSAIIYTNKSKYVEGEKITILIYKKLYSIDGVNEWHKWGSQNTYHGETVTFKIGVYDNDETIQLHEFGQYLPTDECFSSLTPNPKEDLFDDYTVCRLVLDTEGIDITEKTKFTIKAEVYAPKVTKFAVNDCDKIEDIKTVETAFTVYPKTCKSSTKSAEPYNTEWLVSNQSFMTGWV